VGKAIPCVFALLPDKEKATYLRVADKVLELVGNSEVQTIMMDYEKGMNAAFRSTFEDATIVGCDFHWKQILRRRLAADGLQLLYNNDTKFNQLVHYIWALSYVPEADVVATWETFIQERLREGFNTWTADWGANIKRFIKYVDSTWIGERNPRTQIRKRPLYATRMWNKFEATRTGHNRTNNMCEGYNNAFSLCLPTNASVWSIIDQFRCDGTHYQLSH
jgi:MULE transposase domain